MPKQAIDIKNWVPANKQTNLAPINYISASKLPPGGSTEPVVIGLFEEAKMGEYGKNDFYIRTKDGGLTVLNGCTSLEKEFGEIMDLAGEVTVAVFFNGKIKLKNGKDFNSFTVLIPPTV